MPASKVDVFFAVGRFYLKSLRSLEERRLALRLRYQCFQVELLGLPDEAQAFDEDEYDSLAEHLGIFDEPTGKLIATCRLIHSKTTDRFYSMQEFQCEALIGRKESKIEIGRVCIHPDFRRGVVMMLIWRGIAECMAQTESEILFGCGSIQTLDANEAVTLYRYLQSVGKVAESVDILPQPKCGSLDFERLYQEKKHYSLTTQEITSASHLIPPLCRSYFDIGCYVAGPPAFDLDFKCIDFLTVLEWNKMDDRIRKKMFRTAVR